MPGTWRWQLCKTWVTYTPENAKRAQRKFIWWTRKYEHFGGIRRCFQWRHSLDKSYTSRRTYHSSSTDFQCIENRHFNALCSRNQAKQQDGSAFHVFSNGFYPKKWGGQMIWCPPPPPTFKSGGGDLSPLSPPVDALVHISRSIEVNIIERWLTVTSLQRGGFTEPGHINVVLSEIPCEDKFSFLNVKSRHIFTFEKPAGQWWLKGEMRMAAQAAAFIESV